MDNKKILIIDDEINICEMLKEYFTVQGYEVGVAFNGEEGLEKIKKFKPDLILLDILMPELDGISVLKEIRNGFKMPNTPVIMLTNLEDKGKIEEAMTAGASHYLIKVNCSPADLNKKIKQIFDSAQS